MTNPSDQELPDSQAIDGPPGRVNVEAGGELNLGGDVAGRDKLVASGDIIQFQAGATVLIAQEIGALLRRAKQDPQAGSKLKTRLQARKTKAFYDAEYLKAFLFERDFTQLPKDLFIDYPLYLRYYPQDAKTVRFTQGDKEKSVRLPYKEEINFIQEPEARIEVAGEITPYQMPEALRRMTENNLRAIQSAKTIEPNSILRMSSFRRLDQGQYQCRLQSSTYDVQARTNLTVDYPLEGQGDKTLRLLDMGEDQNLRRLEDSLLVNSVGVSAVVYYIREGRPYFFMKPRRSAQGVFGNMFGSVSGVMQLPPGARISELVAYAQDEVRREFSYETGLKDETAVVREVKPLAFVRELTRGGKPQFFFRIEIREISEDEFSKKFKKSLEGLEEYLEGVLDASPQSMLSPEFASNLVYAFQYFQALQRQPLDPIRL